MAATTTTAPARPTWRAWIVLLLLGMPLFMMAADFTAIFLAMSHIGADLAPTTSQMLWIVHVGELVAAGMLITMGWLTARIGPRTLLLVALALYGIASALAGLAANAETLLVARVLIGLATAAASPAAFAMLRSLFTSARHYGIAFAVVMGAFTVGLALGPPLTGLLLEHFSWGSVFLVNVPVAAVALLVGLAWFPSESERTTDRLDVISVAVSIAAVTLTVFGLQEIAERGFSPSYAVTIALGIVLGAWFLRRQRRITNPLLDLDLFAIGVVRIMTLFFVLTSVAFVATDFVLIQYLQIVAGVPSATLGMLLAAPGIAAIIGTALTPVLTLRFAPSTVIATSLGTAVLGTGLILIGLTAVPATALLVAGLTIMSFGMSPAMVLGAQLMITSVPRKQTGPATAIQDITASVGAVVGIVVLGSLAMAVFTRAVNAGAPEIISGTDLEHATDSLGGAVAFAETTEGPASQQLLSVIHEAWSWGTIAAYVVALLVGLAVLVITWRGLRGVELPSDDEQAPANVDPVTTVPVGDTPPQSAH